MHQNEQTSEQPSEAQITRINELTSAGRANWLVLLAYLAFVLITTLGVSDADFFINSNQTQLPLIGVSIPTVSFFTFAPIVGAALFVYLHLHIRKVSEALACPPPGDPPLEERISPWLLNDFILRKRRNARGEPDGSIRPRALDRLADLTTLLLVWWSGPLVLVIVWERTWPAHLLWLSLICAATLIFTIYAGVISWVKLIQDTGKREPKLIAVATAAVTVLVLPIGWLTTANSKGFGAFGTEELRLSRVHDAAFLRQGAAWLWNASISLAEMDPIDLTDARFSSRPSGWKSCINAQRDFRQEFAERESLSYSSDWGVVKTAEFHDEWRNRRRNQILEVETVDLSNTDLRMADFSGAFGVGLRFPGQWWEGANFSPTMLEGSAYFDDIECKPIFSRLPLADADLRGSRLQSLAGVNLQNANLDRSDLSNADLTGTILESAQLNQANLSGAILVNARLTSADLYGANLSGANGSGAGFVSANLLDAQLEGANFEGAYFNDADLQGATMDGATLKGAWFGRTKLAGAHMEGTDLQNAKIEDADFLYARITGDPQSTDVLRGAVFKDVQFEGTAFRYIDLSLASFGSDNAELSRIFQNSFGDATVDLPSGVSAPCQWSMVPLSDEEFFARWRGWLTANPLGVRWEAVAPPEWHHIEPQEPDELNCVWLE